VSETISKSQMAEDSYSIGFKVTIKDLENKIKVLEAKLLASSDRESYWKSCVGKQGKKKVSNKMHKTIEDLTEKVSRARKQHVKVSERVTFLQRRIKQIYGIDAFIDLLKHHDNPMAMTAETEARIRSHHEGA